MHERKTVAEMIGEFLREMGTLYFIFGVLDAQIILLERKEGAVVPAWWFFGIGGVSVLLLSIGAFIERLR
jgi:hypothetical protein